MQLIKIQFRICFICPVRISKKMTMATSNHMQLIEILVVQDLFFFSLYFFLKDEYGHFQSYAADRD